MRKWIVVGSILAVSVAFAWFSTLGPSRGRGTLPDRAPASPARTEAPARMEPAAAGSRGSDGALEDSSSVAVREKAAPEPLTGTLRGLGAGTAELTWTPLLAEFEGARYLRSVDYERVSEVSVATSSAADGTFAFPAIPPGAREGDSAVWITQRGREATPVLLGPVSSAWRWPESEALAARSAARVVVRRAGRPVAGATVRHNLTFRPGETEEGERRVRRVFLRELLTDGEGVAWVAPGSGENALQADQGGDISALWTGEPAGTIELDLLPTITVSGRVVVDDPGAMLGEVRYIVGFTSAEDGSDLVRPGTSLGVRADGSFGPDVWPLVASTRLQVDVVGGRLVPARATVLCPEAGGSAWVELETRLGLPFEVAVQARDGRPIRGAALNAAGWDGSEWFTLMSEATGEDGRAVIHGPAGSLSIQVTKSGFTSIVVEDSRTLVPQAAPPLTVVLSPAGEIEGFVRAGSEPVRSFTVLAWNEDRSYNPTMPFEDEEGAFRLRDVPKGETIYLIAYTDALPQSDTATVVLREESVEVELELPEPRRARGRVIDAVTFEPVPSARIQHLTAGMGGLAGYRGPEMEVEADGSFELDGFHPGRGGFACTAEGYDALYYSTRESEDPVIDVGLLALNPLATLELQVREAGVSDFSSYRASSNFTESGPRPLGSDGYLELNARAGPYRVTVARPDGGTAAVVGRVLPGERKRVELDFAAGIELRVMLAERPPGIEAWSLCAFSGARERDQRLRARWSRESACFTLRPLDPGDTVLELRDAEERVVVQSSVQLTDAPRQSHALLLAGEVRRVRLVNRRGDPWASRPVTVSLDDASGWSSLLQTDAQGELSLGPLDAHRLVLSAKLANESIAYGIVVDLEPDPARTTVVEIDVGPRALLVLREEGRPLGGIHMMFTHDKSPRDVFFSYISDESGLVRGPFLGPGVHTVSVNHRDFWPLRHPVSATDSPDPVPIELYGRGELALEVTGNGARALAGVRCELVHQELGESAEAWLAAGRIVAPDGMVTGADGRLLLAGVPRGTYRWTCTDRGGSSATGTARLEPRGKQVIVVRLAQQ
jgi:hypothetical protein